MNHASGHSLLGDSGTLIFCLLVSDTGSAAAASSSSFGVVLVSTALVLIVTGLPRVLVQNQLLVVELL
jgi:hypothetical protein